MTATALERRPSSEPTISPRLRSAIRASITLAVFAAVYEAIAATSLFPAVLMPSLIRIGTAGKRLVAAMARRPRRTRRA